jgi:hypothetical protein
VRTLIRIIIDDRGYEDPEDYVCYHWSYVPIVSCPTSAQLGTVRRRVEVVSTLRNKKAGPSYPDGVEQEVISISIATV